MKTVQRYFQKFALLYMKFDDFMRKAESNQ